MFSVHWEYVLPHSHCFKHTNSIQTIVWALSQVECRHGSGCTFLACYTSSLTCCVTGHLVTKRIIPLRKPDKWLGIGKEILLSEKFSLGFTCMYFRYGEPTIEKIKSGYSNSSYRQYPTAMTCLATEQKYVCTRTEMKMLTHKISRYRNALVEWIFKYTAKWYVIEILINHMPKVGSLLRWRPHPLW